MCPICYYHEIAGLIQPKLSMFSTCNHWFQAPSPPLRREDKVPITVPNLATRDGWLLNVPRRWSAAYLSSTWVCTYPLPRLLCPYLWYPQSEHYWPTTTCILSPWISWLFYHFPCCLPYFLLTLVYHCLAYIPPSTGSYHPLILSYNNCCYNQSLPHTTSYFRSIGSHKLPISRLTSSSPPSSFDPDCSFLIR